jgi:hypothetical protein
MTKGYLFRIVSENGSLLDKPVSYSVVYQRLRHYLTTLGIYDGETPHSSATQVAITVYNIQPANSTEFASFKATIIESTTMFSITLLTEPPNMIHYTLNIFNSIVNTGGPGTDAW